MSYGRCRPARPFGPIPAAAGVVLGWLAVGHNSGQGWVQDLGALVAAAVAVGLIGPWLVLRRVRVEVVDSPTDGAAGLPVELRVTTTGPARLKPVSPAGSARSDGTVVFVPARRGVFRRVTVEVASAAPYGLQWWTRRVELELPRPLHVAPRRGRAAPARRPRPDDGPAADGAGRRSEQDGDLRSPRPYRWGDTPRLVHWPASAHTGELMVRDLERSRVPPAELRVTLPADPGRAEEEAERAYATVLAWLELDVPVLLSTLEEGGPVIAVVGDSREAGRRLALAVSGGR